MTLRQPVLRGFSTALPQMREKGPFGIELAGDAEPEHRLLVVLRRERVTWWGFSASY
jgi:hypothetical protein